MATMPAQKPGRSKQDYRTPPEFLAAVRRRLGIDDFDFDLAADEINCVCNEGEHYYDADYDALQAPWKVGDGWNWLNPPYANIMPWVQRAYEQWRDYDARTVVLVPASVGANWWRDWVHEKAMIWFLNGRLTFVGQTMPYPKDCALIFYGGFDGTPYNYYDIWSWREQTAS